MAELDVDSASALSELDREGALQLHLDKRTPAQFDDDGHKVCVDCEERIPAARAAISVVVRCLECQRLEERL